eukprot:6115658-Amphidinium_carterae.1
MSPCVPKTVPAGRRTSHEHHILRIGISFSLQSLERSSESSAYTATHLVSYALEVVAKYPAGIHELDSSVATPSRQTHTVQPAHIQSALVLHHIELSRSRIA